MNMWNVKHLFVVAALACSSFAMAEKPTDIIQDIEEVKAAINERIDEEAVKFIADPNMSEKKKKQCIRQLKKVLISSKKTTESGTETPKEVPPSPVDAD